MIKLPKTPSLRVDGRRALVTGGTSGIGLGCAAALAEAGAHVTLMARRQTALEETAEAEGGVYLKSGGIHSETSAPRAGGTRLTKTSLPLWIGLSMRTTRDWPPKRRSRPSLGQALDASHMSLGRTVYSIHSNLSRYLTAGNIETVLVPEATRLISTARRTPGSCRRMGKGYRTFPTWLTSADHCTVSAHLR